MLGKRIQATTYGALVYASGRRVPQDLTPSPIS